MAQHAALQVGGAAVGIDDAALCVAGDGVDGEIAPRQVLFQRHVGRGINLETLVAARGLALGARQGVFLPRLRVQEHRKVLAHPLVAQAGHVLRRGADHDVVAVLDREPEKFVADRAADSIDLHRWSAGHLCRGGQTGVRPGLCIGLVGAHEFRLAARLRHPFPHRGQIEQRVGVALRRRRQRNRVGAKTRGHRRVEGVRGGELAEQ